jgi:flagellar basal body-associated protein FliL
LNRTKTAQNLTNSFPKTLAQGRASIYHKNVNTVKPDTENPSLNESEEAELAALDAMLLEENPEIFNELESLKSEKIENVVSEFEIDPKISRLVKIKDTVKKYFFKIKAVIKLQLVNTFYFFKHHTKVFLSTGKQNISNFAIGFASAFEAVPLKQKIKIIFSSLFILSLPFGIWFGIKKFLDFTTPGIVTDLSVFADAIYPLEPNEPTEDFLRSTRSPPNIFLIKRFVVNIAGKGDSGSPMMAAEIYLESLNPHSLAEIKSRESYFRDIIITFSSQWSYEDLATREGKERYLNSLRDELQNKIRKGKLSRCYFKSIILKP